MNLEAYLTFGWQTNPEDHFSAARIHQEAEMSSMEYKAALANIISNIESNKFRLTGLELLFRRRTQGFVEIKKLISTLVHLPVNAEIEKRIICEIDAFAYSFLKGAKNFDLVVPLTNTPNPEFDAEYDRVQTTIKQLEAFERKGKTIAAELKETYLALRDVMVRSSARDERRALATLLISGPSNLKDVSQDLGLNYTLGQRTLAIFLQMKVVERSVGGIFCIRKDTLPIVVFCLREAMGIDLLATATMG